MASAYPTHGSQSGGNHASFYPHSVAVVNGMPFNGVHSNEPRSATITSSAADVLSTPKRSAVIPGNPVDMSNTSPYRPSVTASNAGARSDVSRSPYQQRVAGPSSVEASAAGPRIEMEGGQQVVYSSQPMSSAEYAAFIQGLSGGGGVSNYFQGSNAVSASYSSSFTAQPSYSYSGGPQQQPLAQNLVIPSGVSYASNSSMIAGGHVGLTPRSYQEQMNAMMAPSNSLPQGGDSTMVMFAENFKNQVMALSQYYAANPNAVLSPMKSPRSNKPAAQSNGYVEPAPAPALMRPALISVAAASQQNQQQYILTPVPAAREFQQENNLNIINQAPPLPEVNLERKLSSQEVLHDLQRDDWTRAPPVRRPPPKESPKAAPKGCCWGFGQDD